MSTATSTQTKSLLSALKQYWGYDSFRPLQQEAMMLAMERRDSVVVLPTGGGKSLCYQAPAVCSDGMAIVVSPLIALMKDQVDALTACGIPAAFVNSSLSVGERRDVARRVASGQLKLLFAAPERLVQESTIRFLQQTPISFIAIDEAHCISHWGHDFRPEYRQMNCLREAFPDVSFHALTATATERVRTDICEQLQLSNPRVLVGSFDRPNLVYRVERRSNAIDQIRSVLQRRPGESGIVYCISRNNVEETSKSLNALGYKTLPYHAGLDGETRRNNQEAFINDDVDIIVATVAFGMGIDKSNVRFVIHAEMPRSVEAWQQESGRAGRDGLESECWLFYSGRDTSTWEFLIDQSESADNRASGLAALKKMESFCISHACRHAQICRHFGESLDKENCGACDICLKETEPVTDSTVVAQKILSGIYRQGESFGAGHTCQVLRGSRNKKILSRGHEKLSTWGILKDESEHAVRSWIDQLLAQEMIIRDGEHPVLKITPQGWEVMRGQRTLTLTKPRSHTAESAVDQWDGVDRELFDHLRQVRMDLAVGKGVPPYVVFGDVTLRELAKYRPTTKAGMLSVYGIGEQKMEQFGQTFLVAVSHWCNDHDLENDVARSAASVPTAPVRKTRQTNKSAQYFELFEQGLSVDEAALQLDLAHSTVMGHLASYITGRHIENADCWVAPATIARIEEAIGQHGTERLKPIYEALDGEVGYDEIRLVVACFDVRQSQ